MTIPLDNSEDFSVGSKIVLSEGTPNEEYNTVVDNQNGQLTLAKPIIHNFNFNTSVNNINENDSTMNVGGVTETSDTLPISSISNTNGIRQINLSVNTRINTLNIDEDMGSTITAELTYADDTTETFDLPFIAKIGTKYYYSHPWRPIKSIKLGNLPQQSGDDGLKINPTNNFSKMSKNKQQKTIDYETIFDNSLSTDGSATPCAECGVTGFTFGSFHGPNNTEYPSEPGTLYFDNLGNGSPPHSTFVLKLEDQNIYGSITISFELVNRKIIYKDPSQQCYEVKLEDIYSLQIMKRI